AMATKLKRSVFIGLGGTGIKSILKTKQLYKDAFGEVPQIIGFLGIDTSTEEFAKDIKTTEAKSLKLEANEQVKLTMSGPLDYYHAHKDRFNWVHKNNVQALTGLSANGAGQIRTNGRFSFTINYSKVENGIRNVVDRVSNATNDGKGKWELVDDKIQIYLVFSLSGGTGCGTFLNTAYLIKELYGDSCVLQAYAVLPNAFQGCGQFVGANAYGALLDTDYLMSYTDGDNPFNYALLDEDRSTYFKPFDLVYLVDNMNKNGDKYTDPNQLYVMIGQALLAISGSIGSASAADMDNFKQLMIDGSLDVEDKKAWVSGLGLCEILVNTKKLSKKYRLKAGQKLVSDMIGHANPNYIDEIALAWVNTNNIREHEDDQLLNSLYEFSKIPDPTINATKAEKAETESESYVSDAINQATKAITEKYAPKLESVKANFFAKISNISKNEGGLASALAFIEKLTDFLNLYIKEMKEELVEINQKIPNLKSGVKEVIGEWKHKKLFSRREFGNELGDAQFDYVKKEIERIRHEKAFQFFLELKEYINSFETPISETSKRLDSVGKSLRETLSNIEITSSDVNPFQIDLAASVPIDGDKDADCTVTAFAKNLKGEDILTMQDMTSEDILNIINGFTATLAGANFEGMSLENIIIKLDDDGKRRLFEKALRKAEIVLDIKNNGYNKEGALRNALYISVVGGKDGAIANDEIIKQMLEAETGATKPTFAAAPTDKSIMIFRQKGVFPVFQIATIERQQRDYEKYSERKCFSFDAGLQEKLEDLHYGFTPNQQKDDDVLEMWVKGFIHGLIKKDGQRYTVWSPALCKDDDSSDYMYKLKGPDEGQGTEARYFAYEDFKANKKMLKSKGDLLTKIYELEDQMGRKAATELYTKIQNYSFEEYVDEYVKIGAQTINNSLSYKKTKTVLLDEGSYRRKKLVSSLDNR
ncbi:MAG: hypothetical protein HUJ98_00210, partial [Bacteroidaceae bacterium]|nr:hypothetical protein [Bacteroidaceae bacterium]